MAGPTKMIIFTSNEDVIRQFSLNNAKNTRIIDLDDAKQMVSNGNSDSDLLNLAFLAQMSDPRSRTDQTYKRVLDSSDVNPLKAMKVSRKSLDTICVICGDHAIGFNYDVLSCASCKAFFRRNANQKTEKIRCLTGQGQCSFVHGTRRKCARCRLDRCFAAGMRKDFILSDEEKQRRRKRLEQNRGLTSQRLSMSESINSSSTSQSVSNSESSPQTIDEFDRFLAEMDQVDQNLVLKDNETFHGVEDVLFDTLSVEDWVTIQSLQSSFIYYFQSSSGQCTDILDLSDRTSALISWSEFGHQLALRFINFFRQINDFQSLLLDDRLILIKYNLFPVFPLCKCYNYDHENDCCSNVSNDKSEKHKRFFLLVDAPNGIRAGFGELVRSLVQTTEQDPILLSLLLIILMLTPGLSMDENEPPLQDPLSINRVQSHYIKLLWSYLVNQCGEIQACRRFTQLLTLILRMQSSAETFRLFFRDQYVTSNAVDKIAPLMQSVLHFS